MTFSRTGFTQNRIYEMRLKYFSSVLTQLNSLVLDDRFLELKSCFWSLFIILVYDCVVKHLNFYIIIFSLISFSGIWWWIFVCWKSLMESSSFILTWNITWMFSYLIRVSRVRSEVTLSSSLDVEGCQYVSCGPSSLT
jgi:hypothetical protein